MKNILTGILAFIGTLSLSAQTQQTITVHSEATGKEEVIGLPEGMLANVDSLYMDWKNKNYITANEDCRSNVAHPVVSDSVYIDRLSRIPSIIEMPYNEAVRKFIDMYTSGRLRSKAELMLAANNFYVPLFEEALDVYDLPLELKYLPIIESALNPTAVSRQGATGLWQFMLRTSKIYGLTVNSLVDERRDPVKSTWAAVRYMKDLYDIYNDWNLVLAAYNCGPGTINKAIKRADGKTDFWDIYPFLPKETRGYVPGFIAINYIMNYYCEHGICMPEAQLPVHTDTVQVDRDIHLQQIADICQIDMEQLRSLNPQYKRDIVPGSSELYAIRLPEEKIGTFIELQDSIYSYKASTYLKKRKTVAVKDEGSAISSKGAVYHKIRKNDTLGSLAVKYRTTVKKLQRLNPGVRSNNLKIGRRIRVK